MTVSSRQVVDQRTLRRMVTHGVDTSSSGHALRRAIQPRNCVLVRCVQFRGNGEEVAQRAIADLSDFYRVASDRNELQFDALDNAGKPKTPDGRTEEIGVLVGGTFNRPTVGAKQHEAPDMTPKSPSYVVILSMNVIGDRSADRDKFCAW